MIVYIDERLQYIVEKNSNINIIKNFVLKLSSMMILSQKFIENMREKIINLFSYTLILISFKSYKKHFFSFSINHIR